MRMQHIIVQACFSQGYPIENMMLSLWALGPRLWAARTAPDCVAPASGCSFLHSFTRLKLGRFQGRSKPISHAPQVTKPAKSKTPRQLVIDHSAADQVKWRLSTVS